MAEHRSRAAERIEAVVDELVAEYATSYCLRPVARRDTGDRVIWSVDNETMVELVRDASGPSQVRVHEIGLLTPLKKQLRSKRVSVEHTLRDE